MNKYVKDSVIINATEKAYEIIYRKQGFIPYKKSKKNTKKKEEADK